MFRNTQPPTPKPSVPTSDTQLTRVNREQEHAKGRPSEEVAVAGIKGNDRGGAGKKGQGVAGGVADIARSSVHHLSLGLAQTQPRWGVIPYVAMG